MPADTELLHGTLDTLVLKTLAWAPRHGYSIARWIESVSGQALQVEEGSLYPALYRLERKGWIVAEWGLSDTKRRVKIYSLTPEGRDRLAVEVQQWQHFANGVARVLLHAEG